MSSSSPLPKNAIHSIGIENLRLGGLGDMRALRYLVEGLKWIHGTTFTAIEIELDPSSFSMSSVSLVLESGLRISYAWQETTPGSFYLLPQETSGSTTSQSLWPTDSTEPEPSSSTPTSSTTDSPSTPKSSATLACQDCFDYGIKCSLPCRTTDTRYGM